jgi:hypothetical protein
VRLEPTVASVVRGELDALRFSAREWGYQERGREGMARSREGAAIVAKRRRDLEFRAPSNGGTGVKFVQLAQKTEGERRGKKRGDAGEMRGRRRGPLWIRREWGRGDAAVPFPVKEGAVRGRRRI